MWIKITRVTGESQTSLYLNLIMEEISRSTASLAHPCSSRKGAELALHLMCQLQLFSKKCLNLNELNRGRLWSFPGPSVLCLSSHFHRYAFFKISRNSQVMPQKGVQVLQAQGHWAQHWLLHWSCSCAPVMHEQVDLSVYIWFCPTLNILCIFPSSELFVRHLAQLSCSPCSEGLRADTINITLK